MQRIPLRICGTGMYVPEGVLDNAHFERTLDTSDEWIASRTGIRERRQAGPDECTSTMSIEAAKLAIADANLEPDDIDLIVCCTATPDYHVPSTGPIIQAGLGIKHATAFDVGSACAGFLHGLIVGTGLLHSGLYRHPLIIGAETLTRTTDPQDRTLHILFGDGAGAAVLGAAENDTQGVLFSHAGCDGTRFKEIWTPSGGSKLPVTEQTMAERLHYMRMRGREVFKFAVIKIQELIDMSLKETGLTPDDLKLVIPHQSNLRIIEAARKKMGLAPEKFAVNIDRYGNTSAASVIISLDEARRDGTVQPGDNVMLLAIGAGMSWATMVLSI